MLSFLFLAKGPPFSVILVTVSLFKREGDIPGELTAEQVDHHFIGAHHDGGVGDLSDQVGGEAAVQGAVALLFGHCS